MTVPEDPGSPTSYLALDPGTAVCASDGSRVGEVTRVLAVEEEDVFDGLIIATPEGSRFIDAPDIAHIAERRVDLSLTPAEVAAQPEHEHGVRAYHANVPGGRAGALLERLGLKRLWRRDR